MENFGLKAWAPIILQRHKGKFASHPVFQFLIFNILVRASNRRISIARMSKGAWSKAQSIFSRLSAEELLTASEELRTKRVVTNSDVQWLLRELSIFGHSHPLYNESRLVARRQF